MQQAQSNKPSKLNLDKSRKHLAPDEMFFALNHDVLNRDALGKSTPFPANEPLCEIDQPDGEGYVNGSHYSPITNEAYSWHINDEGANYIMRAKGDGNCEIVYDNDVHKCLSLSADPKHSIEDWRALLHVEKVCTNRDGKYLVWTNGEGDICLLDVEASIKTNSFTTPFFERCLEDPCDFIRMCVPKPCGSLVGEFIPLPDDEVTLTNHMIDAGFKFMFQHEYYDGRKSDWSEASTFYWQDVKGCFDSAEGFPRCLKLRVPVGNAMVDKIHIAFNRGGIDEAGNDVWHRSKIIEKYETYTTINQKWYEREFSKEVLKTYSDDDCSFDYIFCNNDQCEVVDPLEIGRVYNPTPRDAQGLIPVNGSIGFYNYKSGTCPIDKNEIQKFKIDIDCKESGKECEIEYVKVKVRSVIHNTAHNLNQFVFIEEDDTTKTEHRAKFGGLNPALEGYSDPMGYDQYFEDKTRNFIAYIEGTDYWVEMKQYKSSPYFKRTEFKGIIADMGSKKTRNDKRKSLRQGNFYYQEAELRVPKGMKGFIRLASHHATGNEQSSSTFVIGKLPDIHSYTGDGKLKDFKWNEEEIYFDTCNPDIKNGLLEINETLVIQDNAVDKLGLKNRPVSAFNGYLTDEADNGIEGAIMYASSDKGGSLQTITSVTDHNGFFHMYFNDGFNDEFDLLVKAEIHCGAFAQIKKVIVQGESGINTQIDVNVSKDDSKEYQTNSQAAVKVNVKDCNGRPVGGVRVALSGSKYDITDGKGEAKFIIRNYDTRSRNLRAVVMNHKGCFNTDCKGECNSCFTDLTKTAPACFFMEDAAQPIRVINMGDIIVNTDSILSRKGKLKDGGAYPFGFVVKGRCGRISAVNELPIVEIPKLQKGDSRFCGLSYNDGGIKLPSWGNCFEIVRGKNLNPFELQWLVDKAEKTSDGKIKLTIQSMNDYAELYFFKTNTIYQWLKGDRVEFISKADGTTLLSSKYNGILNYLTLSPSFDKQSTEDPDKEQPADYFNQLLIDDDGRLDAIFSDLEGAKIEIQRAKDCVLQPVYFGIGASIPIVQVDNGDGTTHGELEYPTGTLSTFDTYLIPRKVGKFVTQHFEHHSPSDFWGDRMDDTGRAYFVNKYETEKRFNRSISLCAPNQLNYFGDLIKTFNAPEQGDIIAMKITDGKIVLVICENDNFIVQTADELVRVGGDGIIRALPANAIISDPQPHLQGVFGCQYGDIGSILFGDGFATFVDGNKGVLVHHQNYQVAVDASEGKVQSYFEKRCHEINYHNKNEKDYYNHLRYAVGYNKSNKSVYLTIKRLRDSGVMNQSAPYLQTNETIVYHPASKEFLTFFSATPERYSELRIHDKAGCAFLSYLHGQPYVHPVNVPTKTIGWNEFYGVACDRLVGISINKFPEKIKLAVAVEIMDEHAWFAKTVETDKPEYLSEIPPKKVVRDTRKWNASFLGNKNARDGLFGKEKPRGYYISVLFCRDNSETLKYNTIDESVQIKYDELDEILSKFTMSEQSGFELNL